MIRELPSLLQVKHVIDRLKAIDTSTLTETEQGAVQDCLQQAYDRAAFLLRNRYAEFIADAACTFRLRRKG